MLSPSSDKSYLYWLVYLLSNMFSSPLCNKSVINDMFRLFLTNLEGPVDYDALPPIQPKVEIDKEIDQLPTYNFIMFNSLWTKGSIVVLKLTSHVISTR
jgi:hypothetical protein